MPDSPLGGVYLFEVYWLAETVRRSVDEVFERAPRPPGDGSSYVKADEELHATLYAALNAAARLRALLEQRDPRKGQSARKHAFQVSRTRWLRTEVLKGLKLGTLLNAKVRHTLEHFDEYLDATALRLIDHPVKRSTYLPFDVALGSRPALDVMVNEKNAQSLPLRVYYAEERTFVNAGHSIDLVSLRDQAEMVAARIRPKVLRDDSKGGGIVVITQRTFLEI